MRIFANPRFVIAPRDTRPTASRNARSVIASEAMSLRIFTNARSVIANRNPRFVIASRVAAWQSIRATLLCAFMCLAICPSWAHSFTNHAGLVVSGEIRALTADKVTIGEQTVPLSIFPKREQRRICALGGKPRVPASIRAAIRGCEAAIARSKARAEKGIITQEAAAAQQKRAREALEAYLKKRLQSNQLLQEEYNAL